MPWLDLGNVPSTHTFMRTEQQQVYYIPKNRNPDLVHLYYSRIMPKFTVWNMKKLFDDSNLMHKEVKFQQFIQTINLCDLLMHNYRRKIFIYDNIGYGLIVLGFVIIILLAAATNA